MITTTGFFIDDHGDPSVGIFPQLWELKGELQFSDEADMETFKRQLTELFQDFCEGKLSVMAFEEQKEEDRLRYKEDSPL